jgi:ankyrin repeat protein
MKIRLNEDASGKQKYTALIKVITIGNIAEAKRLITEMNNEEINAADENGSTVLHKAALGGRKELCELLISKMSIEVINTVDNTGRTALHWAAFGCHKEICEIIINIGFFTYSLTNRNGYTALHYAASNGHKEVCKLLISMYLENIATPDNNGSTPLHLAALGGHKEVCEMFISKNPVAIYDIDDAGSTALHVAALKGHKEVCELLVNKISSDPQGLMASMANHLLGGAQGFINYADKKGDTALHLAAKGGHMEVCKMLIGNITTKKILELKGYYINSSPIHKAIGEIVTEFMKDKFSGNEIKPIDLDYYQIKLLKLHQVVDHVVLKPWTRKEESSSLYINNANKYIAKYYFKLIRVCKSVSEDSPISIVVESHDCMSHILSYLVPHSLCPELFAPVPVGLLGEAAVANPENGNEREKCIVS